MGNEKYCHETGDNDANNLIELCNEQNRLYYHSIGGGVVAKFIDNFWVLNEEIHVAFVINETSQLIYKNGELIDEIDRNNNITKNYTKNILGRRIRQKIGNCTVGDTAALFKGEMRDIRMYNKALTGDAIAKIYNDNVESVDTSTTQTEESSGTNTDITTTPPITPTSSSSSSVSDTASGDDVTGDEASLPPAEEKDTEVDLLQCPAHEINDLKCPANYSKYDDKILVNIDLPNEIQSFKTIQATNCSYICSKNEYCKYYSWEPIEGENEERKCTLYSDNINDVFYSL